MSQELGDCLLHLEHHNLGEECYKYVSQRFSHFIVDRQMSSVSARNAYQAEYEAGIMFEEMVLIGRTDD